MKESVFQAFAIFISAVSWKMGISSGLHGFWPACWLLSLLLDLTLCWLSVSVQVFVAYYVASSLVFKPCFCGASLLACVVAVNWRASYHC